ncbi:MAG: PilZ domain-containing protein [Phycisphaeraceae bacterium]
MPHQPHPPATSATPTASAAAPMTVERRRSPRLGVHRAVKLRCGQTGVRYLAGFTSNVSACGALVELEPAPLLAAGEQVELAIADQASPGLLRPEQVIHATVVRSLGHGRRRYVALRFAALVQLAQAG